MCAGVGTRPGGQLIRPQELPCAWVSCVLHTKQCPRVRAENLHQQHWARVVHARTGGRPYVQRGCWRVDEHPRIMHPCGGKPTTTVCAAAQPAVKSPRNQRRDGGGRGEGGRKEREHEGDRERGNPMPQLCAHMHTTHTCVAGRGRQAGPDWLRSPPKPLSIAA